MIFVFTIILFMLFMPAPTINALFVFRTETIAILRRITAGGNGLFFTFDKRTCTIII